MATNLNLDSVVVDQRGRVSFSGLASGIDLQGTVDSIIEAKRIPIDRIEQQVSERETEIRAIEDFRSLTRTLNDAAENLKGTVTFDGSGDIFQAKQVFASSSRTDTTAPSDAAELLGVTVTNAAQSTSHTIEIEQVAAAHKVASDTVAGDLDTALGLAGDIDVNGTTITVDAGDTLRDIRDRINAANQGESATGVTASIVSLDDTNHTLILSADDTGTDATMTLADTSGSVLESLGVLDGAGAVQNELQAAANARFTVDGLATTIVRQSNTVDDVFNGVTLSLFKAEAGTTIDLDVERDLNQVKQAVVDFVDAYNEVRVFINQQAQTEVPEDDETGAGVLASTSILSDARGRLSGAIGAAVEGEDPTFAVLAQIGIEIQGPGEVSDPLLANTLEIDEATLDDALLNDPEGVRELFAFGMSSSSSDVTLLGFDGDTGFTDGGYTLNVAYSGGAITSANLGGAANGSDDGSIEVDGNVLTVVDGPAKGLKMLFTGDAAVSGVQIDVSVGIGAKTFHTTDAMIDDVDGLFDAEIDTLTTQNERGQERIDRLEERLDRERERLIERFAAMEAALASMNQLIESLRSQIESAFGDDR